MAGRAAEEELLKRLPSQQDGIDNETEAKLRTYGAESIQRAGVLLRVPQITIVSASVIFQHFYCRRSFAEFDVQASSCAALLVACKLEETHRKLRDVVTVFHRLQMRAHEEKGELAYAGKPTPLLDPGCREYTEMKQEVVRAERHLLLELGFEVERLQEHPHRHLLQFAHSLGQSSGAFLQQAWNFLNDSLRSLLICAYDPRNVAAAGIFLAARATGLKLPSEPPWWYAVGADLEDVRHIAKSIIALYRQPPALYTYVPPRKKTAEKPAAELAPATPFPETPGPAKSPSASDGERDGNAPEPAPAPQSLPPQDSAVDAGRLAEMIDEQRDGAEAAAPGKPAKASSGVAEDKTILAEDDLKKKGKKDSERKAKDDKDKEKEKSAPGRGREKEKDRERERNKEREKKKTRDKRNPRSVAAAAAAGSASSSSADSSTAAKRAKTTTKQRASRGGGREKKGTAKRASSSSDSSSSRKPPKRRKQRSVNSDDI